MRLKFDYNSADEDINVTTVLPNSNRVSTFNHDEVSQYQYEDNGAEEVITEDFQTFENEVSELTQTTREEMYDQKFQPTQPLSVQPTAINNNKKPLSAAQQTHILPQSSVSCSSSQTDIINIHDDSPVIELNSNNLTVVSSNPQLMTSSSSISTPVIASVSSNCTSNRPASVLRDQWDAFGELVANEFRNLNSDVSRKHLKRKIMQAMLEVGEEDDTFIK